MADLCRHRLLQIAMMSDGSMVFHFDGWSPLECEKGGCPWCRIEDLQSRLAASEEANSTLAQWLSAEKARAEKAESRIVEVNGHLEFTASDGTRHIYLTQAESEFILREYREMEARLHHRIALLRRAGKAVQAERDDLRETTRSIQCIAAGALLQMESSFEQDDDFYPYSDVKKIAEFCSDAFNKDISISEALAARRATREEQTR